MLAVGGFAAFKRPWTSLRNIIIERKERSFWRSDRTKGFPRTATGKLTPKMLLYLKVFHLTFVVTWFAAMFYLPRLFVYHAQAEDQISIDRFKVMEQRLYRGIMTPSALLTLVFGLWMTALSWPIYVVSVWFWLKVLCVVLLFGFHGMCGSFCRAFANEENKRSDKFFRWFNEVPLVLLTAILLLVVVKPFS